MHRFKVGLIDPVGGHGGMDYYDFGLGYGLSKNGIDVYFHTCNKTKVLLDSSFTTIHYSFGDVWKKKGLKRLYLFVLGYLKAFIGLKKNKIKIIHLQFFHLKLHNILVLIIAKIFSFKLVVTMHDIKSLFGKKQNKFVSSFAFKMMSKIIVHNNFSKKELFDLHPSLRKKTSVVAHGNYKLFLPKKKKNLRTKNLQNKPKINILFFGQIRKVKGLDILLDALELVKKSGLTSFCLTIAGKPTDMSENLIRKMIIDRQLEDFCFLQLSYIENNEVSKYYNACDVIVLPYRMIYQSGVLLMAMSYEKAIICSDLEPFKDILTHKINALIFKRNDKSDLAANITNLIKNPQLKNKIESGLKEIITKFNWSLLGSSYKKLYLRL